MPASRRHDAPRVPLMPLDQVEEMLLASFDARERGEDGLAAMDAVRDKYDPPPPDPAAPGAERLGGLGWTPDRQRAFLAHLAANGCVSHACRHVGLSTQSAYQLRNRTPSSIFAIFWDVAIRLGRRRLLDEATERAFAGREVPVWHRGEQVGTRLVHNDRLLMFLLAHQPEPAHPNLNMRELGELWSTMMDQVDAILPPSLSPDRIADLAGEGCGNGNDRR